jgi:hypothetical protein
VLLMGHFVMFISSACWGIHNPDSKGDNSTSLA